MKRQPPNEPQRSRWAAFVGTLLIPGVCAVQGRYIARSRLALCRRYKHAAKKGFSDAAQELQLWPQVTITDKRASYGPAEREILVSVEHRHHRRLNNRAETSHQLSRHHTRTMRGFTSHGHAQRFLSACGPIHEHFCPRRH